MPKTIGPSEKKWHLSLVANINIPMRKKKIFTGPETRLHI